MREKEKPTRTYEKGDISLQKNRKYMTFYIFALFSLALVLIALSYITQEHANKIKNQLGEQTTVARGAQQRAEQLQNQFDDLIKEHEELEKEHAETLEELTQAQDRIQAVTIYYKLKQAFEKKDTQACLLLIAELEEKEYKGLLIEEELEVYESIYVAVDYPSE